MGTIFPTGKVGRKWDTQRRPAGQEQAAGTYQGECLGPGGRCPSQPSLSAPDPGFNFSHIVLTHFHRNQCGPFPVNGPHLLTSFLQSPEDTPTLFT